ncbi:hypothetical protein AGOR_G00034620 [Albula goreensis]|uniref:Ig-like domain-containing protein n=1 Tax=Albula goreensis TaxID=1534307 RepID=A0A8T3DZT3_9TELE|nr:hypothetical protein AGOR_G00034620 [Albula goreensis]
MVILAPFDKETHGKNIPLACLVFNAIPEQTRVFWKEEEENVTEGTEWKAGGLEQAGRTGVLQSHIRVPTQEWTDGKTFTCVVETKSGLRKNTTVRRIGSSMLCPSLVYVLAGMTSAIFLVLILAMIFQKGRQKRNHSSERDYQRGYAERRREDVPSDLRHQNVSRTIAQYALAPPQPFNGDGAADSTSTGRQTGLAEGSVQTAEKSLLSMSENIKGQTNSAWTQGRALLCPGVQLTMMKQAERAELTE